jgi:hypothetical protein
MTYNNGFIFGGGIVSTVINPQWHVIENDNGAKGIYISESDNYILWCSSVSAKNPRAWQHDPMQEVIADDPALHPIVTEKLVYSHAIKRTNEDNQQLEIHEILVCPKQFPTNTLVMAVYTLSILSPDDLADKEEIIQVAIRIAKNTLFLVNNESA